MRIALTFDDGPNTSITPQVLDVLEEHGIVGTFFLIAGNIFNHICCDVYVLWTY